MRRIRSIMTSSVGSSPWGSLTSAATRPSRSTNKMEWQPSGVWKRSGMSNTGPDHEQATRASLHCVQGYRIREKSFAAAKATETATFSVWDRRKANPQPATGCRPPLAGRNRRTSGVHTRLRRPVNPRRLDRRLQDRFPINLSRLADGCAKRGPYCCRSRWQRGTRLASALPSLGR